MCTKKIGCLLHQKLADQKGLAWHYVNRSYFDKTSSAEDNTVVYS